ncbi:MAG: TolC family protein [Gammaproteobacteria bacterium]
MRFGRASLLLLILSALTGCASYTPLSLPTQPDLASIVTVLTVPVTAFDTPGVQVTRVDLRQPLNAAAVAALAVLNNPVLRAMRASRGVAAAQSYAAGLLPWPQIGLGASRPAPGGAGLHAGWSVSVGEEFAALLQHADAEKAARADEMQVRLDVVWNEWQVAQQARLLYAAIEHDAAQLTALQPLLALYADRARAGHTAFLAGALSRATVSAADAAYTGILAQADTLELARAKHLAALTGLLGLAPHTPLRLALDDHPAVMDAKILPGALGALPHRRPDLMAFAAAYRSADARLRQAVLTQFPLIGVSLSRERDTEGVISNGVSLTFNLPFLNAARGQVAVARATRQSLHDAYQARLDAAVTEVASMSDAETYLHAALVRMQHTVSVREEPTDTRPGMVPFDMLAAQLTQHRQMEDDVANLRYTLDQATIGLDTVLGMPLGHAHPSAST